MAVADNKSIINNLMDYIKGKKFYKVLNKYEDTDIVKYKEGLNDLTDESIYYFLPENLIKQIPGENCFTEENYLYKLIGVGDHFRQVSFPIDNSKFKIIGDPVTGYFQVNMIFLEPKKYYFDDIQTYFIFESDKNALLLGIASGFVHVVEELLKKNIPDADILKDAINIALANKHFDVVGLLIVKNLCELTLTTCVKLGYLELVIYLIDHGVNVHENNEEALQMSALKGHLEILKVLIKYGANIHADNELALRWAASKGHLDVVTFLLKLGADVHAHNDGAFSRAALCGKLNVVMHLISVGVSVGVNNNLALRWSAAKGHIDVIIYLVSVGADIHANNDDALCMACRNGHIRVVKYLVKQGANIHANQDKALRTSLKNCHFDVFRYLVKNGADIDVNDNAIFKYAMTHGYAAIAEYVLGEKDKNIKEMMNSMADEQVEYSKPSKIIKKKPNLIDV